MATQCTRCNGCGQIANTPDGEPWTYWMDLPLESAAAVLMGIVEPIPCPQCGGFGHVLNPDALHDLYRACRATKMLIGSRLTETDDFDSLFVQVNEALIKARGAE